MSTLRKPHVKSFIRSGDIHPQSSDFGRKWPKWCPKNPLYLQNRKSYQKSDLIFRTCDKFSFRYISSDFYTLSILTVETWLWLDQFSCLFLMVLGTFSATTWTILIKLGLKFDKIETNQTQKTGRIFRLRSAKNKPKLT